MKNLFFAIVISIASLVSSLAHAARVEKPNEEMSIRPSLVEQAIVLQKAGGGRAAIALVKISNGGSSDTSSYMSPSRLVLGVHLSGEMFDIDASYEILESLVSVESAKYDAARKIIRLVVVLRAETMKPVTKFVTVDVSDVIGEIAAAHGDEGGYSLKAKVAVDIRDAK